MLPQQIVSRFSTILTHDLRFRGVQAGYSSHRHSPIVSASYTFGLYKSKSTTPCHSIGGWINVNINNNTTKLQQRQAQIGHNNIVRQFQSQNYSNKDKTTPLRCSSRINSIAPYNNFIANENSNLIRKGWFSSNYNTNSNSYHNQRYTSSILVGLGCVLIGSAGLGLNSLQQQFSFDDTFPGDFDLKQEVTEISEDCQVLVSALDFKTEQLFSQWMNVFSSLFGILVGRVKALTPNISHLNFIADVVDSAGPSVVFLEVKGEHPDSGRRITLSNGSGFIVRSNGLILTSAHVVANKIKVVVKLQDGDVFEGTVTAVDPVYDLATIKIEADKPLQALPLGRSSEIRPGEFVVAMGSPLSLSNTVTSGIVSSSLRGSKELGLDNKNMQYIQTDAVISFGNSGGPLVNLDGKAIGINNLKITSGISFAIPADYAFGFLEEAERIMEKTLKSTKPGYIDSGKESHKKRRFMGISMLTLTTQLLNELKDRVADFPNVENGVYVHKVIVGSPAYEGGIHAGDIIVEVNGNKIQSTVDIYREVEENSRLNITAVRGNYLHKISVTTEELF